MLRERVTFKLPTYEQTEVGKNLPAEGAPPHVIDRRFNGSLEKWENYKNDILKFLHARDSF